MGGAQGAGEAEAGGEAETSETRREIGDELFFPAEEMAALWVNSPKLLGFRGANQALNNDVI